MISPVGVVTITHLVDNAFDRTMKIDRKPHNLDGEESEDPTY
jgi:hypothetical protein